MSTGITYRRLLPGVVPVFEELEACRFANYNYQEWLKLEPEERAIHAAFYRISKLIELHGQDAVGDKVDRDMKKVKMKRR